MHLRCFVAVAEELHFGRAAARLNMTQPPLSRQIQILERLLNVDLLKRTSRSVELTHAGRAFLVQARAVVSLAESAALVSQKTASGQIGSIALGFTAASGYSQVPRIVGRLRADLPDVDLTLREMVSEAQIDALLNRRIDIGLLRPPIRHRELDSFLVSREGLLIASPAAGVAGRAPPVTLGDFQDLPTIMFAQDGARYFFELITGLFAGAKVSPRYVQSATQIHSILALVGAGLGVALVPEAAHALHFEGVEVSPLPEGGRPVELLIVWRRDNENPILGRVLEGLRAGDPPAD